MTREEAIGIIRNKRKQFKDFQADEEIIEAFDIAINAMQNIEDIKSEIENTKYAYYGQLKGTKNCLADGLDKALEIIDKYIGSCDTCNNPCVMYEKGMKGCKGRTKDE